MTHSLLVFDWDGTLMDSTAAIVRSIQGACRDLGLEPPGDLEASWVIGLGLGDALRRVAPDLDPSRHAELAQAYRRHYFTHDEDLVLFPGVLEMLLELKRAGRILAVATGKSRVGLDRALAHAELRGLFDATRTADETASKPHPQMLLEIIEEFAEDPARTLMVGDTVHDLRMARHAGTGAVAVSYGAHSAEELAAEQPLYMADSVAALRRFLAG